MKVAGLERVNFEQTFFFAPSLNDVESLEGLVHEDVARLELDDLGQVEGTGQERHVGHDLIHTVELKPRLLVFEKDGLALEFVDIEGEVTPL